jgi:hypothetical protein
LVFADAPPANANAIPATPNSGTARLPRFRLGARFVCDIPAFSNTLELQIFGEWTAKVSLCKKVSQFITMHRFECVGN